MQVSSSFRRGRRRPARECPGRGGGASANPAQILQIRGVGGTHGKITGDYPPEHSQRARGDFRSIRGERVRRRPRPPGPRRGVRSRRKARIPRMPWQGARRLPALYRATGKVFFSPARPNLAGSGESGADAPVLRRGLGAQRHIFCDKSRKTVTVRVGQSALAAFHQVTTNPAAATLQLP